MFDFELSPLLLLEGADLAAGGDEGAERLPLPAELPPERGELPPEPDEVLEGRAGAGEEELRGAAMRPRLSLPLDDPESRFGTMRAPPIRSITCRGIGVGSGRADSLRGELPWRGV
jgi:hypothetical protein